MDKQTWVCVDEAAVTIRPHASPVEQQRWLVVSCWLEGRPCCLEPASYTHSHPFVETLIVFTSQESSSQVDERNEGSFKTPRP